MTAEAHNHEAEEVCEAGLELYAHALRTGRIPASDAEPLPCLISAGLLQPDLEDTSHLRPVAPAVALARLLRGFEEDIARRRRQEASLADAFEPFLALAEPPPGPAAAADIRLLSGLTWINLTITQALAKATTEMLTIQPHTTYIGMSPEIHAEAMERDQSFLDRGGRIRTLYQHTTRHIPMVAARYEQLRGDVAARTMDEVTERLLLIDRTVAFIPANKERTLALEVREPALVSYFATTFDRLWRLATPMYPEAVQQPTLNGVTPRQRAIAALLIEGHTDAVIADRLGMNIRTARVHIAKLAATLGSESRAQLGYLIGQSGILDQEPQEPQEPEAPPAPPQR
ncbi:helix-turn-helix transcriptional regulator [Streptomyces regalis]|uniref:LuxR family transcriptional regulator n=1 Tax=Streptomyces regalis TaxID=68262 RepID=A0A0X3VJN4_9ACTN|nr:helix-turn-helix transcriptional regulator [Streptomyces regalis]KUL45051.1 LuxR family transcriptional regulator [Streptomyces regalis]